MPAVPDSYSALPAVGTDVRIFTGDCGTVIGHSFISEKGVMHPMLVIRLDTRVLDHHDINITSVVINPDGVTVRPWGDTLNTHNSDYWLAVARYTRAMENA